MWLRTTGSGVRIPPRSKSSVSRNQTCIFLMISSNRTLCEALLALKLSTLRSKQRKDGRAVHCTNFENWRVLAGTGGSNPSLSEKINVG
jgi:hypothetical protein